MITKSSYFEKPLLSQAFDSWLALLPPGARVLDAGCGHGEPVITQLLEKGLQVTGVDMSPAMIRRAQEQFPQVTFLNKATQEVDFEVEFDGVCSLSSLLYLDPVDLFHSIYRLHCALKPGGLLFVYGYDLHPGWRGHPFDMQMDYWMWEWTYSMTEAAQALAEHGYFEVLGAYDVTSEEDRAERRARALQWQQEQEEALQEELAKLRENNPLPEPASDEVAAPQSDPAPLDLQPETLPVLVEPFPTQPDSAEQSPEIASEDQVSSETLDLSNLLSNLPKPPFSDPVENLPYHYVIIARRREQPPTG